MTLIDTAPGFGAVLEVLGAELGVAFPVEEMTARLGPPLDHMLGPHLGERRHRAGRRPVPRALPRPRDRDGAAAARRRRGGRRRRPARRPGRRRHRQVHAQRAAAPRPPRPRPRRAGGRGLGCRQGRGPACARVQHLRRRPRPRRRGRPRGRRDQRLRADRGLHPRGAARRGHPRRARRPHRRSPRGSRATCSRPGSPPWTPTCASEARCWSPTAAAPTARCCSRPRSARSGRPGRRRDRLLRLAARRPSATRRASSPSRSASGCSPPRPTRWSAAGYRANSGERCFFCKAELLDVLAPLAAELGLEHVATGTNADDVVAGFRPGIRAAAERGAITPLADAGLTKAQVRAASRALVAPDLGQAAGRLPLLADRLRHRGDPPPAGAGRAGRGRGAGAAAALGVPLRDLRVRDLGDRASLELDARAAAP